MLTQSNEHRSLVWIALAEFVAEINEGLKKEKVPNAKPGSARYAMSRVGGVFDLPDPSSEFHQMGLACLGEDSGDLRESVSSCTPFSTFNKANRK